MDTHRIAFWELIVLPRPAKAIGQTLANSYMSERRYGAFEGSFQIPQNVDETRIEASFSKGLLTVSFPKSAEAQKSAKTIPVKAA